MCTEYCHPTIWNSRTALKVLQKHKLKVNILFRCSSIWPGYCIMLHHSPTRTEKEYNTTLAYAGPKSSHHLWRHWWGRDCMTPEFVCWTWSPEKYAETTKMTSQHMLHWKRSLISFFFVVVVQYWIIIIPACSVLSKQAVYIGGGWKRWNRHQVSVNLSLWGNFPSFVYHAEIG